MPGVRLHADTPRGPPLLTGLNPTVYWCTNQPTPVQRWLEVNMLGILLCHIGITWLFNYLHEDYLVTLRLLQRIHVRLEICCFHFYFHLLSDPVCLQVCIQIRVCIHAHIHV